MTLQPGTHIGPYQITGSLGAGCMGEVYRARDSRLGRDVAIKILPGHWLSEPARRARFEREARVLASLNHPHIGAIYGFEEGDGLRALVLELVEGPTLADRLDAGPLGLPEVLRVAAQIADALEAAHEQGIIHRDLKPANVILGTRRSASSRESARHRDAVAAAAEATVKVVDFGIAKEIDGAVGVDTQSPTVTADATREGVLLGTAAYMSPEQARGAEIDKRTDIWAFGCVLYEMLTGRSPFAARTVPDTLAAVIGSEPDWNALPGATPRAVRQMLRRCLEKDRRRRLHDAGDVRIAIEDAVVEPELAPTAAPAAPTSEPAQTSRRRRLLFAAATLSVGALIGWVFRAALSPGAVVRTDASAASEMRLEIVTAPPLDPAATSFAISPDGRKLAFVGTANGRSIVWVRPLDSLDARALRGTEGALFPFWSPDAREIGFFADFQLKRIDVEVGTVQVIAPAESGRGGAWGRDGVIVFAPDKTPPLARVASTGGAVVDLAGLSGRFPHFLPDGVHFLYQCPGSQPDIFGVCVAKIDGSGARFLLESDGEAVYALGHLFFPRGVALLAQAFDVSTLALSGSAFAVANGVGMIDRYGHPLLSAAAAGPIVYRRAASARRQFVWVNRDGGVIARVGDPIDVSLSPELSPDERLIAYQGVFAGKQRIWLMDAARGVTTRLPEVESARGSITPVWSPDGSRLAIAAEGYEVFERELQNGEVRSIVASVAPPYPGSIDDWSPDGRHLLCQNLEGLRAMTTDGRAEAISVGTSGFGDKDGVFSPDGKWVAYTSNLSGEPQVYIQRFPEGTGRVRVSTSGGGMARWRSDGAEIFYLALDGKLMAVPLRVDRGSGTTDALEALAPVPLFDVRLGPPLDPGTKQQYMVARDGKRFLLNAIVDDVTPPVTVILNWRPQDAGTSGTRLSK